MKGTTEKIISQEGLLNQHSWLKMYSHHWLKAL